MTVIGDRLRAPPPQRGNSVDTVETPFPATIMQTAVRVVQQQERKLSGGGCNGDAQSEAELTGQV